MDFLTMLDVLRRHWIVLLVGIGVTGMGAVGILKTVGATYSVHADYLLMVPDKTQATGNGNGLEVVNPYLYFESGLRVTAEIIITAMGDEQIARTVKGVSQDAKFSVFGTEGAAPVVAVEVTDGDANDALEVQEVVHEQIVGFLQSRQRAEDVPKSQMIQALPLTVPLTAQRSLTKPMRGVIAIGVVGVGATILLVFAVDAMGRRRRPESRSSEPNPSGEAQTAVEQRILVGP